MRSEYLIKRAETTEEREAAFRLRYAVYCEDYNYLDAEQCPSGQERDPWDEYAHHFLMLEPKGRLVGTARLIHDSPLGFQTESYGRLPCPDRSTILEFSRLVLHRDVRGHGHGVILDLWKALFDFSRAAGVRYWYTACLLSTWKLALKIGMYYEIAGEASIWSRGANDSVVVIPAVYDIEVGDQYFHQVNPRACEYFYGTMPGTAWHEKPLGDVLHNVERDRRTIKEATQRYLRKPDLLMQAA